MYHEWLRVNQGFDHKSTLEHFLETGGTSVLSPVEQESITSAFMNIKKHGTQVNVLNAVNNQLADLLAEKIEKENVVNPDHYRGMSLSDLRKKRKIPQNPQPQPK